MSPERLPLVFYNSYLQHRLRECAVLDRNPCSSHNRRHPVMPFRFIQLTRPPCFLYKSSFLCRQSSSILLAILWLIRPALFLPLSTEQSSSKSSTVFLSHFFLLFNPNNSYLELLCCHSHPPLKST